MAEHLDVDGQRVVVGDFERPVPGRNVDGAVVLELQQHRVPGRWRMVEIQADHGPDHHRLARRLEVQVEDEVGIGIQPPRHAFGLAHRRRPRLPEEEVAVGLEAIGLQDDVHAAEPGPRVARVLPPRGPRAVEEDVGVMHDRLLSGTQLERLHVARTGHGRGDDEVAEHVGALRRGPYTARRPPARGPVPRAAIPARTAAAAAGRTRRPRESPRSPSAGSGRPARRSSGAGRRTRRSRARGATAACSARR